MADTDKRRLSYKTEFDKFPGLSGTKVLSNDDEELGNAIAYFEDTLKNEPRYVVIDQAESFKKNTSDRAQLILPVGVLSKDNENLKVQDHDLNELKNLPVHHEGQPLSYEEELQIRARLEQPDKIHSKLGKENKQASASAGSGTGNAINKEITDPEDAYKRDKDVNEGRISDSMQGRYTPNLDGDVEGIKKSATNAEGKHDIPAGSGHSGSTSKGSVAQESGDASLPDENELPTTDRPGATLGNAEVENQYRDPENHSLPRGQGNPELPLNAPDHFYEHPLFDTSGIR